MLLATQRSLARTRRGQPAVQVARGAVKIMSSGPGCTWQSLGAGPQELNLDLTMPTGQSFRWRKTGADAYTGVIGARVVQLRQRPGDVEYRVVARGAVAPPKDDAAVLSDYFNLRFQLAELSKDWAARDARFRKVSPYFPGARMLRQDPMECLFQFICSSNNHISRIHGMVERLCSTYGTPLTQQCSTSPQQWQRQQDAGAAAGLASMQDGARPTASSPFAAQPAQAPATTSAAGPAVAAAPADRRAAATPPSDPTTPVPLRARAAGELATPRLASALGHMADDVAEARVDGGAGQGFATPAAAPVAGGMVAGGMAEEGERVTEGGASATEGAGPGGSGANVAAGGDGTRTGEGIGVQGEARIAEEDAGVIGQGGGPGADAGLAFYAFPTLEQLAAATEEELRAAGFG